MEFASKHISSSVKLVNSWHPTCQAEAPRIFFVCFGATSGGASSLLLAVLGRPDEVLEIEYTSALCKLSTLPAVLPPHSPRVLYIFSEGIKNLKKIFYVSQLMRQGLVSRLKGGYNHPHSCFKWQPTFFFVCLLQAGGK